MWLENARTFFLSIRLTPDTHMHVLQVYYALKTAENSSRISKDTIRNVPPTFPAICYFDLNYISSLIN